MIRRRSRKEIAEAADRYPVDEALPTGQMFVYSL
jgi:hypothetical protein